jgi:hypothetical protein
MTNHHSTVLFAISVVALLGWGSGAEAATKSLMIPAADFSSDGVHQGEYYNGGIFLDSNVTKYLHAPVYLPNASVITNVDMMTYDNDVGTILMDFKRTKFGFDGGAETLLSFSSPGNLGCSSLCHDMEFLPDITVDASNYSYWLDLVLPAEASGTDLRFYAVRIMYEVDDLIFADTFESADFGMWSETSLAKAGHLEDEPKGIALPESSEPNRTKDERIDEILGQLYVEDPQAQEALEMSLKGQGRYGSPLVVPGPAFNATGYSEYDDYYFSESYGFLYARPSADLRAIMTTGVNLPDGAEIAWYMAFFVDSTSAGATDEIVFELSRLRTTDRFSSIRMVDERTTGASDEIRSISVSQAEMEAVEPGCTTIDNSVYYYWAHVSVGPYDLSPPPPYQGEEWWHKVYAVVILYTMP